MVKENDTFTVRIPKGSDFTIEDLTLKAEAQGLKRSDLVFEGIDIRYHFDPALMNLLKDYAKGLNTSIWVVIQNMLLEKFAEEEASIEVWGPGIRVLEEFIPTKDGILTGKKMFDNRFEYYREREMSKRIQQIRSAGIIVQQDREFMEANGVTEEQIFGKTE